MISPTFINKETINRLLKDIRNIIQNPLKDNGIYYIHDDVNILKGYALIIGSDKTPYFGGFYFFEFNYPPDYPRNPPVVIFHTNGGNIRFNPNLYKSGKVCVSILNTWRGDQWSSCQTISSVLLIMSTILCENPLLNEPGVSLNNTDLQKYNDIIEYSNINIAICDIINKNPNIYKDYFNLFYDILKINFLKNYDELIKNVETNIETFKENPIIVVDIYHLVNRIDYMSTLNKLKECKLKLL